MMVINGCAICNWEGYRADQPCWGKMLFVMDCGNEGTIDACEGHEGMWDGEGYKPASVVPTREDRK